MTELSPWYNYERLLARVGAFYKDVQDRQLTLVDDTSDLYFLYEYFLHEHPDRKVPEHAKHMVGDKVFFEEKLEALPPKTLIEDYEGDFYFKCVEYLDAHDIDATREFWRNQDDGDAIFFEEIQLPATIRYVPIDN